MLQKIKNVLGIKPKIKMEDLIINGAVILDVRSKSEFSSGHVKGSVNVPLDQLDEYTKKLKNKEQILVTCCASGMRSGIAKGTLKSRGFQNVHNGGSWMNLKKFEHNVGKHKI